MIKKTVFSLFFVGVMAFHADVFAHSPAVKNPIELPAFSFGPGQTGGSLDLSQLENEVSYNISCIMFDQTTLDNAPQFTVASNVERGGASYLTLNGKPMPAIGNQAWQGELQSHNDKNTLAIKGWYADTTGDVSKPLLLFRLLDDKKNTGISDVVVVYSCVATETN